MLPLFLSVFLLIGTINTAEIVDPETCVDFPCKIFEDNFDTLDLDVWDHEINMGGGGNYEFQAYVNNRSVSYVRDGTLYIKPQLVSNWRGDDFLESGDLDLWGMNGRNQMCTGNAWDGCRRKGTPENVVNPVMSARLRTLGAFSYKYGKLEVRAKLPRGQWMWPAVWLLPDGFHYGEWPASGEIDIFEMRGNDVYGDDVGNEYGGSTIHWGPYFDLNRFPWTHQAYPSPDGGRLTDDYHTWTVEWTDNHLRYWLDDNETPYFEVDPITNFWDFGNFSQVGDIDNPWVNGEKMAPFDKKFYIIINIAIGGTGGYFPDDVLSEPAKPWNNEQPVREAMTSFWEKRDDWLPTWQHGGEKISEDAALKVDYVRVFKIKDKNV